jgi:hypothetical protein
MRFRIETVIFGFLFVCLLTILAFGWRPLVAAASSLGTSPTTWQVGGSTITRDNTANFTAGPDMLLLGSNPPGQFQIQVSANTTEILSIASDQAGAPRYCRSITGSDSYTCELSRTLTIYTPGSCLVLTPDTANTGAATLNVDTLGALPILTHSGGAPADGDIPANLATLLCLNADASAWSRP